MCLASPLAQGHTPQNGFKVLIMYDYEKTVHFCSDGLELSVRDHANLLLALDAQKPIEMDAYSRGGAVAELEDKAARFLGKERAIFMPSGTLANQIAISTLAGERSRILTHRLSHLANDCGDCIPKLNRLNLIPLGQAGATFTLEEIEDYARLTGSGKVETGVGVILIETPVRRLNGEMFDFEELKKISAFARQSGIKLHLDGARIFLQSAYTGVHPSEYAAYFDTVYFSLWKCLNTPVGAILAGAEDVIGGLFHVRRMFGGCLYQAWPFAAAALHFFDGLLDRLTAAMGAAKRLMEMLSAEPDFNARMIQGSCHIFRLELTPSVNPDDFRQRLAQTSILLPKPENTFHGFLMRVNESLNQMPMDQLAGQFKKALT
jgi:threonine aldolase